MRVVIRPERVRLEQHSSEGENRVPGMVQRLVYLGPSTQVIVRLAPGETIQALIQNQGDDVIYRQGTPVIVYLPSQALRILRSTPDHTVDVLEGDGQGPVPAQPAAPPSIGSPST